MGKFNITNYAYFTTLALCIVDDKLTLILNFIPSNFKDNISKLLKSNELTSSHYCHSITVT